MCRNISYPESPFVPYAIRDGLCHRGFPFLSILYQRAAAKTIGKGNKEFLFELYKTEVYIKLFVTYIDEHAKVYYDVNVVCRTGSLPVRHIFRFFGYSLYSNIRSYMLTVSPSLTPISSMRRKTPFSRRMRSKNMRLS